MEEQRRHPRIRFGHPPPVQIGYGGRTFTGDLINLSLSGLMLRTETELTVGRSFGCEFSLFNSPKIDVPAEVVSCQGNIYGARFQSGPLNAILIEAAMEAAMASGEASVVSIERDGVLKVLTVRGGLNGGLRNDFRYGLEKVGVDELNTEGVTLIDREGVALCCFAVDKYHLHLGKVSPSFEKAWLAAHQHPERLGHAVFWD